MRYNALDMDKKSAGRQLASASEEAMASLKALAEAESGRPLREEEAELIAAEAELWERG